MWKTEPGQGQQYQDQPEPSHNHSSYAQQVSLTVNLYHRGT